MKSREEVWRVALEEEMAGLAGCILMVVLGLNAWAVFTDLLVGLLVARPGDALLDGVEGSAGAGCASVADLLEVVLSLLRGGLDDAGGCILAQADVSVHSVPVLLVYTCTREKSKRSIEKYASFTFLT